MVACRFYLSYNIANYMSGLGSASLFHFDLFANFLSFCWLTGSGGFGRSTCRIGQEQGVGVGVDTGQDLNYLFLWL